MTTKNKSFGTSKKSIRAQLEHIQNIVTGLEHRIREARGYQRKQLDLLESVSKGLYDEIDKLSKKAPSERVTDILLEDINEVIKDTKDLVEGDRYIQRIKQFVAAGDNPEHRDAIVVMKNIRQGLDRFKTKLTPLIKQIDEHLVVANSIAKALHLRIADHEYVTKNDLEIYDMKIPSGWGTYDILSTSQTFNFEKLNKIDIDKYFEVENE